MGLAAASLDCRQDGAKLDPRYRAGYLFNTTIAGIEDADACLLIGTNPRWEAPLVNARLRKRHLQGGFSIAAIGPQLDLSFPVEMLGEGGDVLGAVAAGEHSWCDRLRAAKKPMLVVGQGALARRDGGQVLAMARAIAESYRLVREDWNGFNVLHRAAARVGGLDLGFVPGPGRLMRSYSRWLPLQGRIELLYLLGADEIDTDDLGPAFVVYQGHHGDRGAVRADIEYCRVQPIPKRRGPTSIPRVGCSSADARHFRPATRARIGKSSARYQRRWVDRSHMIA